MKTKSSAPALLILGALLIGSPLAVPPAFADHHEKAKAPTAPAASAGTLTAVTEKDAAWAAQARKTYPLEACVVTDEKLGGMGKAPEYIYRAPGKPDRLVVFCCSGCEEDFLKEPAKHLAKIDAAAAAKAKK